VASLVAQALPVNEPHELVKARTFREKRSISVTGLDA